MKTSLKRASGLACALLATTCLASPAAAQLAAPAPVRQSVDANGVDLFLGTVSLDAPALSMGQVDNGLSYYKLTRGSGWTDNMIATLNLSGSTMTVSLGGASDSFTVSGSTYTPTEGNGATLTFNSTTNIYTYTRADGTIIRFDKNRNTGTPYYANEGRVTDITRPDGSKLVFTYDSLTYCSNYKPSGGGYICMQTGKAYRAASVRNSYGYRLNFSYEPYDYVYDPATPDEQPDFETYSKLVGVSGENLAAPSGSGGPSESFATGTTFNVTDPMGRVTKYRMNGWNLLGITLPGSSSENVTFALSNGTSGRVTGVTSAAGTTSYAASDLNGERIVTVTNGLNQTTTYKFDIASRRMTSVTDANNRTTSMQYDGSGRLTRITQPEGNYTQFTYDARGNVTETRGVAKAGSGLTDIVATASYPTTCTSAATCNQPVSTTDARGQTTDYTYDATHGGLLTVTAPAPTTGAVRPQVRYNYSTLQAYFRNSSNSIVASGEPVTRLTGTSACQTTASCTGTADEVKTTTDYGPQTAGVGNNLLPVSVTQGAGDGSLTAPTAFGYDHIGNLITVDGPLAGTADTTRSRFNAARESIGTVSADPDGAGVLKHRAQRVTIDTRGLATKVERGTVNSQSDADWAAFAPLEAVETGYDAARRPVTSALTAGGTTHALTQMSYDGAGRPECSVVRMNPTAFGSLPSSACTLGTQGSFGPDRITKNVYNAAGEVTQVRTAVGTTLEAAEVTTTYRPNGKVETLLDAENNKTTYEYDGHDRLAKTFYPSPTKSAGVSNSADYEQQGYDAGSNVTSFRNRANQTLGFSYDNLGRLTLKDLPGSEPDVSYGYDLLGRMKSAAQPGHALSFTYDALGRKLTETGPHGTVGSSWDIGGRRTRLTYPNGTQVDYLYLTTGEVEKIQRPPPSSPFFWGASPYVLAAFTYDNLGRRTLLKRPTPSSTSYSYDPVSRLSQLVHTMGWPSEDLTLGFSYNPAGQIVSNTRSNDLYAFTDHGGSLVSSPANGLNQLVSYGGVTLTHDAKGNLTKDPHTGYTLGYSSENLLTTVSGGAWTGTIKYDPLMRLYESGVNSSTRFVHDGMDRIAEYSSSGALTNLFVHGPGVDEPLVEYGGSNLGTTSFLHADERGSIIAASDGSGAVAAFGKFDEYGKPQSWASRFGFAGKPYESMSELYDSRARMYWPGGRFVQPDPIGYGDGMNQYPYAGGDPVNLTDPTGLKIPNYCTGSIIPSATCDHVPFLSINGMDTQATAMARENELRELLPGTPTKIIRATVECFATPGCVADTLGRSAAQQGQGGVEIACGPLTSACARVLVEGLKRVAPRLAARVLIRSVDDVFKHPTLLRGMSPKELQRLIGNNPNWRITTSFRGSRQGEGWVYREWGGRDWTGRQIRWHPGGGRHPGGPYWRVNPGSGQSDIIPAGGL